MNLSDLQSKEIVSLVNGKKLGKIIDVNVDQSKGIINYFVCENKRIFRRIFSNNLETKFTFADIEKIGEDVILVKL